MSRRVQQADNTAKKHRRRRIPLALPYSTPPEAGAVHFHPSVHTAAELMRSEHHTAA